MAFEPTFRDPAHDRATFEAMLASYGFSPDRARAIATKGFGGEMNEADIVSGIVADLKRRRARLEQKSSVTVDGYEGRTSTKEVFYSIANAWMTVSIRPRDLDVEFNARLFYHYWGKNGPVARETLLYGKPGGRGRLSESLMVRDESAGIGERLLGGRFSGMLKSMRIEIEVLRGSSSFDISIN